jgi:Tfp pilus assembly protein PilF
MRALLIIAWIAVATAAVAQTTLVEQGRAALDRNDPQAAIKILESAIAESPQSADAHYQLGVAYGMLAQRVSIFRAAALARHTRDEFERAVKLDPNHLDARYALAEYYSQAPSWLGGSKQKFDAQMREIRQRCLSGCQRFSSLAVR